MLTTEVKRNLFLASFLIITIYVLCFGFLSYHEFKEWEFYPFFESMIGVFMSAGAIAIITGIILVFQAAIQSTQEKNKEVFDHKLKLYGYIIDEIHNIFLVNENEDSPRITPAEREKLFFMLLKVELLSKPGTFMKFSELIRNIADDLGRINVTSYKALTDFIQQAREDLDVQDQMTEDELFAFNTAIQITQAEASRASRGFGSRYSIARGKHEEKELETRLIDYFSDKDCKTKKQMRKKQKLRKIFNLILKKDKIYSRKEIKETIITDGSWKRHYKLDWGPKMYKSAVTGKEKTYDWYVGSSIASISRDFTFPKNDFVRQVLTFEIRERKKGEVKNVNSIKDNFYIEKDYRSLVKGVLKKFK